MKPQEIISEQEFNTILKCSYPEFCDYLERLMKACVEEALRALPTVITHLARQASYLKMLSDNFYKDHKDLLPHKEIVGNAIEAVEASEPGLPYNEILEKSVPKARNMISAMKNINVDTERKPLSEYDKLLKDL